MRQKHESNLGRQRKVHLHFFFMIPKKNALYLSGSISVLFETSLPLKIQY